MRSAWERSTPLTEEPGSSSGTVPSGPGSPARSGTVSTARSRSGSASLTVEARTITGVTAAQLISMPSRPSPGSFTGSAGAGAGSGRPHSHRRTWSRSARSVRVRVTSARRAWPRPRVRAAPISTRPPVSARTSRSSARPTRSVSILVWVAVILTPNRVPAGTTSCWYSTPAAAEPVDRSIPTPSRIIVVTSPTATASSTAIRHTWPPWPPGSRSPKTAPRPRASNRGPPPGAVTVPSQARSAPASDVPGIITRPRPSRATVRSACGEASQPPDRSAVTVSSVPVTSCRTAAARRPLTVPPGRPAASESRPGRARRSAL